MHPNRLFLPLLVLIASACGSSPKLAAEDPPGASRAIAANGDRYVVFVDDDNKDEPRAIVFRSFANKGGEIATCDKNKFIPEVVKDGEKRDRLYADYCNVEAEFANEGEYKEFVSKAKDFLIANPGYHFSDFLVGFATIGASVFALTVVNQEIGELLSKRLTKKMSALTSVGDQGLEKITRWSSYFGRVYSDKRFYRTAADAVKGEKILLRNFKIRSGGTAVFGSVLVLSILAQGSRLSTMDEQTSSSDAVKTVITTFNDAEKTIGEEPSKVNFTAFFRAMNTKEMGYSHWGTLPSPK